MRTTNDLPSPTEAMAKFMAVGADPAPATTPQPAPAPAADATKKEDGNAPGPKPAVQSAGNDDAVGSGPAAPATKPAADAAAPAAPGPGDKPTVEKPDGTPAVKPDTTGTPANREKPVPGQEPWPRNAEDWTNYKTKHQKIEGDLRQELETAKTQAAAHEKRLKELEASQPKAGELPADIQERITRLEKERQEYSDKLAAVDVTNHPKFKAHYEGRVNEQFELAKDIVGPEKADQFQKLMAQPEGEWKRMQIEELSTELSPYAQAQLGAVMVELKRIEREKASEIVKASQNREKLQQEQATKEAAAAAEARKNYEKTWQEVTAELTDPVKGNPLFQHREDEDWNKATKAALDEASQFLAAAASGKLDAKDLVKRIVTAAGQAKLLKAYEKDVGAERTRADGLQTENEKLAAQVKELTAAQPATAGTTTATSTPGRIEIRHDQNPFILSRKWAQSVNEGLGG